MKKTIPNPSHQSFRNVAPQITEYEIRGTGLKGAIEANSLRSWVFEKGERDEFEKDVASIDNVQCPQYKFFPVPDRISSVCLETTFACNLACKYCFVRTYSKKELSKSMMGIDTAVKFLRKYCPTSMKSPQPVSISFFGGEPTLNMDLLYKTVHYARMNYASPRFHATTNGTLLTREMRSCVDGGVYGIGEQTIAEWMERHGFSMIVSIDGPESAHNELRAMHSGAGSFDRVMEGLRHVAERCPSLAKRNTLRGTFTSGILSSKTSLQERIAFLNDLVLDGCGGHVSIEPVTLSEGSCVDGSSDLALLENNIKGLEAQYLDASDWYISEALAGRNPSWHQIGLWTRRIFNGEHAISECGAGKGYLTCMHDGTIAACHRTHNSKIGSMHSGGVDESLRAKWLDNRFYSRKDCGSCGIRFVCGGGCRECSIGESNDITKPVFIECEIKRIWTLCALKIIAALPQSDLERICPPRKPGGRNALQKPVGKDTFRTKRNVFHNGGQLK